MLGCRMSDRDLPPPLSRRSLLCAGLASAVAALGASGCKARRVEPGQLRPYYARGELERVQELIPAGERVEISGLRFVDWAYPDPEHIARVQPDPERWREVCARDEQGGPTHHGIKLAFDEGSSSQLIAFLPYGEARAVQLLKRAYLEGFELRATLGWLGVLRGEVWEESQRREPDMVALHLLAIHRG